MNTAAIILSTGGALILGMAALIKTMVVGKLDDLQKGLAGIQSEVHHIDLRVTTLEAERRVWRMTRRSPSAARRLSASWVRYPEPTCQSSEEA